MRRERVPDHSISPHFKPLQLFQVNQINAGLRTFLLPRKIRPARMFSSLPLLASSLVLCLGAVSAFAQSADDAMRVTVTMNPDGSKTVYQTNGANHETIATTTGTDGKAGGKIIYQLDSAGRYQTGQVFAADGKLRFRTRYSYDEAGRLAEEIQLAKDDSVRHKIVYSYDAEGHPTGYLIYDGAGHLLGRTTPKKASSKR
jgi:YD repeat-containing protein